VAYGNCRKILHNLYINFQIYSKLFNYNFINDGNNVKIIRIIFIIYSVLLCSDRQQFTRIIITVSIISVKFQGNHAEGIRLLKFYNRSNF